MKASFYNLSILLFLVTFLTGCFNKQVGEPVLISIPNSPGQLSYNETGIDDNPQEYSKLTAEDKVRLADIPLIEDCDPQLLKMAPSAERKYTLICNSSFSMEDTINYYRAEMDYLGWKEDLFFIGKKSVLIFKKPSKICIVSLQKNIYQNKGNTNITIFVGPRSIYE